MRFGIGTFASQYKAVVFDVDGTLYRLRPLQRAVQVHFLRGHWHRPGQVWRVNQAVRAYQHATDVLHEAPAVGGDLQATQIEVAARASGLPEEFVRESVRQWMEKEPLAYLRQFRQEGVHEVLCEFRDRGLRLGVFSDFPARDKLGALGIEEFFDVVLSAHDAGVQRFKPDPRGLEVTLEQLGVEPEEAIYVGDRPSIDGVAANRAGMGFLLAGDGCRNPRESFWKLPKQLFPRNRK